MDDVVRDPDGGDDSTLFYAARDDLDALAEIPCDAVEPALKRIGPPPFARKGFPLLGLLATIYDHVAGRVKTEREPAAETSTAHGEGTD